MISRRQFLLTSMLLAIGPARALAQVNAVHTLSWKEFLDSMQDLAEMEKQEVLGNDEIAKQGLQHLQRLDVNATDYIEAVDQAYETGNRYWLWQRLVKDSRLNGGILVIDSQQDVQLHDHPGATGMVRILSGVAEVWQFDRKAVTEEADGSSIAKLERVSHRILKPGDTAVLLPDHGNIHALKAISNECSMLDFFIPPYQRSQRNWFEPVESDWFQKQSIACRQISQHEYTLA